MPLQAPRKARGESARRCWPPDGQSSLSGEREAASVERVLPGAALFMAIRLRRSPYVTTAPIMTGIRMVAARMSRMSSNHILRYQSGGRLAWRAELADP